MTALALGLCGAAVLALPGPAAGIVRLRPPARPRLAAHWSAVVGMLARLSPSGRALTRRLAGTHRHDAVLAVGLAGRPVLTGAAVAAAVTLLAGPVTGLAAGTAVGVAARLVRHRDAAARERAELDVLAEALSALTGELRAGGGPDAALREAARAAAGATAAAGHRRADPHSAAVLRTASGIARLGGDVPEALRGGADGCPAGPAAALRRVAAGWQVSERSGAALGEVLDRVERDLRDRRRHARGLDAQLAGPRATGAMLALLPGFGLLLGTAMGAHPVAVLTGTAVGRLALLAGVVLDAVGALWTARLLRTGVR